MHDPSENERFIKLSVEIPRATGNNLNSRLHITASLCETQKNDETNQTNPVWLRQSNLYNSNWNAMRTKTNYTKWTHWSLIEPNPPKTYTSNQLNIFPSQPFGPRYWSRLSLQSHLGAVLPTMPAANKKQPTDPRYAYIYIYIYVSTKHDILDKR